MSVRRSRPFTIYRAIRQLPIKARLSPAARSKSTLRAKVRFQFTASQHRDNDHVDEYDMFGAKKSRSPHASPTVPPGECRATTAIAFGVVTSDMVQP